MASQPAVQPSLSIADRQPGRSALARCAAVAWNALLWLDAVAARNWQNVLTAFVQVWVNKARSLLTTLGIIIAVTSTITVVSFVQGFGNYVTDALRGFGTNMIFVLPHSPTGLGGAFLGDVQMDIEDIHAVGSQCEKVRRITPLLFMSNSTIEYGHEKADDFELRGVTEQFQSVCQRACDEGRFFGPIEIDSGAHVCVLGREVLRRLECDEKIIGEYVYLNGLRLRVVGLFEPKGRVFDEDQDNIVAIPYTTGIKMAPFLRRFLPFVVEATSEEDAEEASLEITRVLRARHGLGGGEANDFRILRQDELLRDFGRIKLIATTVLAGIVGISLIVGGIGIMNVMFVSVTERTREIGLRKSVGGRRRDILSQFLTEAVVLATVGGAIGIVLGYAICQIASMHPSMVEVSVPIWAVALALSFSTGAGIVFGIIPAFKAAILHPIDALRYE